MATFSESQLGKMWSFAHRVRTLPQDQKDWFKPAPLLAGFLKDVENQNRSYTFQLLDKVDQYITEKRTLTGTWNMRQVVHNRLVGAL